MRALHVSLASLHSRSQSVSSAGQVAAFDEELEPGLEGDIIAAPAAKMLPPIILSTAFSPVGSV